MKLYKVIKQLESKLGSVKKVVFDESTFSISSKQLLNRVRAKVAYFQKRGLKPGDKLLLIAPNSIAWQEIEFAAISYGLEFVALEPHLDVTTIKSILSTEVFNHLIATKSHLKNLNLLSILGTTAIEDMYHLDINIFDDQEVDNLLCTSKAYAKIRIYTSGTTGKPKSISYSEEQYVEAVLAISKLFDSHEKEKVTICWLPMANLFQRVFNFAALVNGFQIYYVSNPKKILNFTRKIRPTVLIAVPHFLNKIVSSHKKVMANTPKLLQSFFSLLTKNFINFSLGRRLKYVICGSAKCSSDALMFAHSLNIEVLEAYGVSECVLPIAMSTPQQNRILRVGRLLDIHDYKINERGELLIKSKFIGNNLIESDRVDSEGYLNTFDRVHIDSDGYVKFLGRSNDLVKTSSGRKISLRKLDDHFSQIPFVRTAVAVAENRPFPTLIIDLDDTLPPKRTKSVMDEILKANQNLPIREQVGAFIVSSKPITLETGLLTRNLKIRRDAIIQVNTQQLDAVYEDSYRH